MERLKLLIKLPAHVSACEPLQFIHVTTQLAGTAIY
jgi:hypothetical protein